MSVDLLHCAVRLHHCLCHLAVALDHQSAVFRLLINHLEHHVDDEDLNDRTNAEAEDHLYDVDYIELSKHLLVDSWLLIFEAERRGNRHLGTIREEKSDHETHSLAPIVEVDCLLSHNLLDLADSVRQAPDQNHVWDQWQQSNRVIVGEEDVHDASARCQDDEAPVEQAQFGCQAVE